jgi:hypothetical protein
LLAVAIPAGGAIACVVNCPPPEFEAIRRMLADIPKIKDVYLCAPKSFTIMQLGEAGLERQGRLSS